MQIFEGKFFFNFLFKDKKYEYATIIAGIALYSVAKIAAFGANAIAGKRASPSLEIALPSSAENGMWPFK